MDSSLRQWETGHDLFGRIIVLVEAEDGSKIIGMVAQFLGAHRNENLTNSWRAATLPHTTINLSSSGKGHSTACLFVESECWKRRGA